MVLKNKTEVINICDIDITKNYTGFVLEYKCEKCHKDIVEKTFYSYKKKLLSNSFVCSSCIRKQTMVTRYGVENPFELEDVKNKIKQTNLNKYGVDNPSKNDYIKIKKSNTLMDNYGVTSTFQLDSTKKTKLEKYKDENYTNRNKAKKTLMENHGVTSTFQLDSTKKTNLEKYGNEIPMKNKDVVEKMINTNIGKYGVTSVLADKNKMRLAKIEKFGTENIMSLDNIKDKIKQTNLRRYGVEYNVVLNKSKINDYHKNVTINRIVNLKSVKPLFNVNDVDKIGYYDNVFKWKCSKCGEEFSDYLYSGHVPRCPKCFPKNQQVSILEKEIVEWIKSLGIKNVIEGDRNILAGKELDIYLPDYNLAVEFNGLYWHSELQGKDRNYHLNKTIECRNKDIQLLHIFEDEWLDKKDIIKNIISTKLGLGNKIAARKCTIKEVDNQKDFLNNNHLQGFIPAKINVGLYYENELISLLALSKSRYNKNYDWEILRYVNKSGISVIGGFAKLLKYFTRNYSGSVITYSDARLFDGSIYKANGFTELEMTKPSYYYFKHRSRFNRQGFMKHKLKNKLNIFDPDLTEWENMQLNKYDRIWDCGNYKFELRRQNG